MTSGYVSMTVAVRVKLDLTDYILLGYSPVDGLPRREIAILNLPVAVIFILLNICGVAFALVCLVFNMVYKDKT